MIITTNGFRNTGALLVIQGLTVSNSVYNSARVPVRIF